MTSPQTHSSVDLPGLPADRRDQIVRRIAREGHVRRSTAERWFDELLKFLHVCAYAGAPVSPPPRVDKAWHVFVLFTRDYRSYCEARGGFIHHDPMEKKDPDAYERAYLWAEARYGALPKRIWPPPASRSGGWGTGGWGIGDFGAGGCGGGGCGGGC